MFVSGGSCKTGILIIGFKEPGGQGFNGKAWKLKPLNPRILESLNSIF